MSQGRFAQRGWAFQAWAFRTWGLAGADEAATVTDPNDGWIANTRTRHWIPTDRNRLAIANTRDRLWIAENK